MLDSKAICHSLDDFAFSKDPSSDETTMFREPSQAPFDDDDDDDDVGGFDGPQADYSASMNVDGDGAGPPPEGNFFTSHEIMDSFEDGGMGHDGMDDSGTPGLGRGQYNAGPGGEQGAGGANGPYGPFDPRRMRSESDRVIAMTDGDSQGGMIELFDQTFLKNWAGPEFFKLRKSMKRRAYFHLFSATVCIRLIRASYASRTEHRCGYQDKEGEEGDL